MSNQSGPVPPFLQGKAKKGSASKAVTALKVPPLKPSAPRQKVINDPPPPASLAGDQNLDTSEQSPLKRAKKDGQPGVLPQLPSGVVTATPSQHLFAALGNKYTEEAETSNWWKASPEENATALTKCLAEAFIRQAAHTKNFLQQDKRIKVLEFQKVEDKRSLEATYKKQLSSETAAIRTDLKNARKERNEFEKSLKELQKSSEETAKKKDEEITKLAAELNTAKAALSTAEEKFLAQGQVSFMKGFIRSIPDFDWDQLGPGNADFAETLKKEIADEDAEEERLAEEARLASEAAKTNQDHTAP